MSYERKKKRVCGIWSGQPPIPRRSIRLNEPAMMVPAAKVPSKVPTFNRRDFEGDQRERN
jgi:hypothetical protein